MAGRRTVTVIFTDLAGSTELSQRLDAASAEELREAHFVLLRGEVGSAGGLVVKNLGDGLMAVCDTPTAALACAVGMQQAVERSNRRAAERLTMRVGIAIGEATESDGDFFGDPVVEAARLCAAARGDQILATDVVRVVAGRHAAQELVPVGALQLKGLAVPVPCVEVRWEPLVLAEEIGFPLPARLKAGSRGGFVGRVEELERLALALREAGIDQRRRLVLVGGEPGIGKSALAAVFARAAQAGGSIVLYGRCDEDLGIPYQPWAEALGHLVDHGPPALVDEVLVACGGVLARLGLGLVDLGGSSIAGSVDSETARYLLFGAVARVLRAAADDRPLVLVLDDVQWAGAPSLQLLRYLIASDETLPMVVVATFRETEIGAGHPLAELLAWLHREEGVTRLSLRGLGDLELLALMEKAAGHAIDDNGLAFRDALARETDGNPFFVGELLRHLIETGLVYQDADGRWAVSGDLREYGLPVSVREVIGRRVGRLGHEAVRVLSTAAVIGRDFDLSLLMSASQSAEEETLDVLDAAVLATLVINVSGERYSFTHALVEHALYDALAPVRRVRAHRRVAEAIEQSCGGDVESRVGELAYHFAQATTAADRAKAIGYSRVAGDRAVTQLAPAEAVRWYGQALSLLDHEPAGDEHLRAALLVRFGDAQRESGDPGFRGSLLEAGRLAERAGDSDTLVAAALANHRGDMSWSGQVDTERVAVLEGALATLDHSDSASHAVLLSILASELQWAPDWRRRLAQSDAGLAMARRLGDPPTLAKVLSARHEAIRVPPTLGERLENTAELLALCERLGDLRQLGYAALWRAHSAWENGDIAEVDRSMAVVKGAVPRAAAPYLDWHLAAHRCNRAFIDGRLEDAEHLAREAYRIAVDSGQPDALDVLAAQLYDIKSNQGRTHEIEQLLVEAAAVSPFAATYHLVQSRLQDGETDAALRQRFEQDAAAGFNCVPFNKAWLTDLAGRSSVCVRHGLLEPAAVLYDLLAPWRDQVIFSGSVVTGSVARVLAVLAARLGRWKKADELFAQAAASNERLGAPVFMARTQVDWARVLLDHDPGQASRASALLNDALSISQELGMGPVERRARQQLARLPASI